MKKNEINRPPNGSFNSGSHASARRLSLLTEQTAEKACCPFGGSVILTDAPQLSELRQYHVRIGAGGIARTRFQAVVDKTFRGISRHLCNHERFIARPTQAIPLSLASKSIWHCDFIKFDATWCLYVENFTPTIISDHQSIVH